MRSIRRRPGLSLLLVPLLAWWGLGCSSDPGQSKPLVRKLLAGESQVVAWGYNGSGQTVVPTGLTGVAKVVAGPNYVVGLKADGTVVGWGDNSYGQTNVPAGLSNVITIATSPNHVVALKADGTVAAWGYNGYGQTNVPAGLNNVVAAVAGSNYSLALKTNGKVVAWGSYAPGIPTDLGGVVTIAASALGSGAYAVKGDGTIVTLTGIAPPAGFTGTGITSFSVGVDHVLALKADGTVVAWGGNNQGQLNVPAGLSNVVAIAAGSYASLALKADGTVAAWGNNGYGQATIPPGVVGATAIAAGQSFSVAVLGGATTTPLPPTIASISTGSGPSVGGTAVTITGTGFDAFTMVTFGGLSGLSEQVVNSTTITVVAPPAWTGTVPISVWNRGGQSATVPSGFTYTATPSQVVAWGYNGSGQTVVPTGLTGVAKVVAGPNYVVGLKADGTVVGWGDNSYGQTNVPAGLSNVITIATSPNHVVALKADGTVAAWGYNGYGQTNVPAGLNNVVAAVAGSNYSLALKTNGKVVAWGSYAPGIPTDLGGVVTIAASALGSGAYAVKGDGTIVTLTGIAPPAGFTGTGITSFSVGVDHVLALKADGTVVAWGGNNQGQLNVPAGLSNVVAIAAGSYASLALKADGTVAAWGNNGYGQATIPPGVVGATAIAAGQSFSVAVLGNVAQDLIGATVKVASELDLNVEQGSQLADYIQVYNSGTVTRSAILELANPYMDLGVTLPAGSTLTLPPGAVAVVPIAIDARVASPGPHGDVLLSLSLDDGSALYANVRVGVAPIGSAGLPDLSIAASDIRLASSVPGTSVTLAATVRNLGSGPASNIQVAFYEFGTLLGTQVLGALPAGGAGTVSLTAPITTDGDHLITVVVDPSASIEEIDRSNNEASQVVRLGTLQTIQGGILVTGSLPTQVCTGSAFTLSGLAAYDLVVNGTRYTSYVVKGAPVTTTVQQVGGATAIYGAIHTDTSGTFQRVIQPMAPGTYQVRMSVTDKTFLGTRELVFSAVTCPATPPPPPPPPVSWPTGTGTWAAASGGSWVWTWTSPPVGPPLPGGGFAPVPTSDLSVFSEDIFFTHDTPAAGEEITTFAKIRYWSSDTSVVARNVPVNVLATFPGEAPVQIGRTVISSISVGSPDYGSRYVYATWRNPGDGVYVIEFQIDPAYLEANTGNNAATRALLVGQYTGSLGVVSGHVTGPWGAVAGAVVSVSTPGSVVAGAVASLSTTGSTVARAVVGGSAPASSVIGSTVTDATGFYLIDAIPPGSVEVRVAPPAPYVPGAPMLAAVVASKAVSTVDFLMSTIAISPTEATVPAGGQVTFTAPGAVGATSWALSNNRSGGNITAAGLYTAGGAGGVADTVSVTDSTGATVTASVVVGATLAISPSVATIDPGVQRTFAASGGTPPYTWSISSDGSGGTISAAGLYQAGTAANTMDTLTVRDSGGRTATALVTVTTPLVVAGSPFSATPGQLLSLTATGGSPPYTWSIMTAPSGGNVTSSGAYTAGGSFGTDALQVADSGGGVVSVTVHVGIGEVVDEPRSAPALGGAHVLAVAIALAGIGSVLVRRRRR